MGALTIPAGAAAVTTDSTLGYNSSGQLSVPQLVRTVPVLTSFPKDGSEYSAAINAFITSAKAAGFSMAKLPGGWARVYNSISIPSGFDLVGEGQHDDGGGNFWSGGTTLEGSLNLGKPVISMVGPGNSNGTTDGYIFNPGLHGVKVTGSLQASKALSGYQPALIEAVNVYHLRMSYVSGGNDFLCFFRAKSVWDSDVHEMKINNGGFCDVTADPTSAAVQAYTGRSAAMASETYVGHSLGVPAVDLWSADPAGQAVTNNLRIYSMHIESNAEGGVPLMVHGGNTGAVSIIGSKLECTEGAVPQIVLDGAHGFYYQGWLYGAATGYPYAQIGGVPNGASWAQYPISAALVLAVDSYNPNIIANGGYANGGNAGQPDCLMRFLRCSNPQVSFGTEDGLNRMKTARFILDACTNVSPYILRAPSAGYVPGTALKTFSVVNGTTLDPNLTSVTAGGATFLAMPWPPA